MKRSRHLVVFAITLVSCAVALDELRIPEFGNVSEIAPWIRNHFDYLSDPLGGLWDAWQTPGETLALGTGDCEDFSLLWLFLVYRTTGIKGELVISSITHGFHVSARAAGISFYTRDDQTELFSISYDDAMGTAQAKRIEGGSR